MNTYLHRRHCMEYIRTQYSTHTKVVHNKMKKENRQQTSPTPTSNTGVMLIRPTIVIFLEIKKTTVDGMKA